MGKKKRQEIKKSKSKPLRDREASTNTGNSSPQPEETKLEKEKSTQQDDEILTEDGILCSIISRLPLREAVRTCVLSRRWRHMWTHLPIFKFNPDNMFDDQTLQCCDSNSPLTKMEKYELLRGNTDRFIQSVNSVLQQHQGSRLEELAVEFFLHKIHSHHLDAWVQFAVASKTKNLGFYLEQWYLNLKTELYDFPCHLLGSSYIQKLTLTHCSLHASNGFKGFNNLKTLFIYDIDITEKDINLLLANCLSLEELGMWKFQYLVTLTIPHGMNQLQSLIVKDCDRLTMIESNAPNLNKMNYRGVPVDFKFSESSEIVHAKICFQNEHNVHNLYFYLISLQRNLPHLKSLTFEFSGVSKVADLPKSLNSFTNLKCLNCTWNLGVKMSFHHLAAFLDAAPFLEELILHLSTRVSEQAPQRLRKLSKLLPERLHSHLKMIRISHFQFTKWQLEIVLYLLKNAIQLEIMTLETGDKSVVEIHEMEIKNLSQLVPANAKLVLL